MDETNFAARERWRVPRKVLEISNINSSEVDRSDVLHFFQNEGTVLYLQMGVDEPNAIICMANSDEINKIMEKYDSKSKRRRFKLERNC